MEKIIEGLINVAVNIISTGLLFSIGYLYWRFIKPAVKIHHNISEKKMPEYDTVDGAVKSSIECNEEGIYYLLKIVNKSSIFGAKDFHIRLLAGKIGKDKKGQDGTRYTEVEIIYGALVRLGPSINKSRKQSKKKCNDGSASHYLIVTTKPLRKILNNYDNLTLIVRYVNTINKEFIIEQTFTDKDIIHGQFSNDDDLVNGPM
jgi:hypothetical protein